MLFILSAFTASSSIEIFQTYLNIEGGTSHFTNE